MAQKIKEPQARFGYRKNPASGNWEPITPDIGSVVGDGRKIVTTAGTREQLSSSSTSTLNVVIQAELDNTGVVVVGGITVVAALATRRGIGLEAGDSISLNVSDLSLIWLDSMVSGDGVTYFWTRL
jgi:hypothetical protein